MTTISMIVGIVLVLLSASLWFGHWFSYIRVRQPFNRASGYQIILITFTAIGLLLGCHLWILVALLLFSLLMPVIVSREMYSRGLFRAYNIALMFVVIVSSDYCWSRGHEPLVWGLTYMSAFILYGVLVKMAFPVISDLE